MVQRYLCDLIYKLANFQVLKKPIFYRQVVKAQPQNTFPLGFIIFCESPKNYLILVNHHSYITSKNAY